MEQQVKCLEAILSHRSAEVSQLAQTTPHNTPLDKEGARAIRLNNTEGRLLLRPLLDSP